MISKQSFLTHSHSSLHSERLCIVFIRILYSPRPTHCTFSKILRRIFFVLHINTLIIFYYSYCCFWCCIHEHIIYIFLRPAEYFKVPLCPWKKQKKTIFSLFTEIWSKKICGCGKFIWSNYSYQALIFNCFLTTKDLL